jgi:hypothetical protein
MSDAAPDLSPDALTFMAAGMLMTAGWLFLDLAPLGPSAGVGYTPPAGLLPQ